jgi:hypothetical protein
MLLAQLTSARRLRGTMGREMSVQKSFEKRMDKPAGND